MSFSTPGNISIERTDNADLYNSEPTTLDKINYIYDITETVSWITENNFCKVCLQIPDHLLKDSVNICQTIKSLTERKIFILADTTYNSCCVDEVAAKHVAADAIIHYGHSCLSPTNFPVFYVYPKALSNLDKAVEAMKSLLSDSSINIVFFDVSLQYISEKICECIFTNFPNVMVGIFSEDKSETIFNRSIINSKRVIQSTELLKNSNLIFLGSEGPALFNLTVSANAREVYLMDIDKNKISPQSQSMWFKRRRFLIEKCKDATNIGILVCTLSIKNFNLIIKRLKDIIKANGKKSYVLSVGKPNVAKLANIPEIEVFVLIACPENDLYSSRDFLQPVVYPFELELALNNRDPYSTTYCTDFNDLLPDGRSFCDISHITKDHSDVSLITGNIRNISINNSNETDYLKNNSSNLAIKDDWAVTELGIGKSISDRSWKGLEQSLGETTVEKASVGRKGIASGYEEEQQK